MLPLHALCTLAQECGIIAHAWESLARNLPLLWRLWWCESFGARCWVRTIKIAGKWRGLGKKLGERLKKGGEERVREKVRKKGGEEKAREKARKKERAEMEGGEKWREELRARLFRNVKFWKACVFFYIIDWQDIDIVPIIKTICQGVNFETECFRY